MRQGLLGPSLFWKVVAVGVFGRGTLKKVLGKQPESLGRWVVGSNQFVQVINARPQTRKERKRSGMTKKARRELIVTEAVAATRAKHPHAEIVVKTK